MVPMTTSKPRVFARRRQSCCAHAVHGSGKLLALEHRSEVERQAAIEPRVLARLGQSCNARAARSSVVPLASSVVAMSSDRRRTDRVRRKVPMTTMMPRVLAQLGQSCYERSARSSGKPLASSIVAMSSDRRRRDRASADGADDDDRATSPCATRAELLRAFSSQQRHAPGFEHRHDVKRQAALRSRPRKRC